MPVHLNYRLTLITFERLTFNGEITFNDILILRSRRSLLFIRLLQTYLADSNAQPLRWEDSDYSRDSTYVQEGQTRFPSRQPPSSEHLRLLCDPRESPLFLPYFQPL